MPFVFVTGSSGKLREAERILGYKLEHHNIELPEIQSVEVEQVVTFKVMRAFSEVGRPVLIEDTGLFIEAWNGLPGALIKWFVKCVEVSGICRMLKDFPDRRAWAKTVVATYDGKTEPTLFTGVVEGQIALTPAGKGGFGWDRIFIRDEDNAARKTFGEMSDEEKDRCSMRHRAFKKMLAHYS